VPLQAQALHIEMARRGIGRGLVKAGDVHVGCCNLGS